VQSPSPAGTNAGILPLLCAWPVLRLAVGKGKGPGGRQLPAMPAAWLLLLLLLADPLLVGLADRLIDMLVLDVLVAGVYRTYEYSRTGFHSYRVRASAAPPPTAPTPTPGRLRDCPK
jgi:hypothetical protein